MLKKREQVFKGRVFAVTVDEVELEGKVLRRDVVHHPGAVAMLVRDRNGRILFVRQYRHPAGQKLLEIPAGTLEEGESPRETALRELREEGGIVARSLKFVTRFYVAPGYSTELIHLFYVDEFDIVENSPEEDEDIEILWVREEEALRMVRRGQIIDAKTIIALLWWASFGMERGTV